MKRLIYFLMAILMLPMLSGKMYADSADCQFYLVGFDDYGDGWNEGAKLVIKQDGEAEQTFTVGSSCAVALIDYYQNGKEMTFSWSEGEWQEENSFIFFGPNGAVSYAKGSLTDAKTDDLLFTVDANSSCNENANITLSAQSNADNTITANWTTTSDCNYFKIISVSRSTGKIIDEEIVFNKNTYTSETKFDGGLYDIIVLGMKNSEFVAMGYIIFDHTVTGLGQIKVRLQIPQYTGFVNPNYTFIYYRTLNDLAVSNSVALQKTAGDDDWWEATIPSYPDSKARLCFYATADYNILTDNSKLGTYPYEIYSDPYVTESSEVCLVLMPSNTSNRYSFMEVDDCNQPSPDYQVKNMQKTIEPGKVVFTWDEVPDAQSYEIRYTIDGFTYSKRCDTNSHTTYKSGSTLESWSVVALYNSVQMVADEYKSADKVAVSLQTGAGLTGLTANFTDDNKLHVEWNAVDGAAIYRVLPRNNTLGKNYTFQRTTDTQIDLDASSYEYGDYTITVTPISSGGYADMETFVGTYDLTLTGLKNLGDVQVRLLVPDDCGFDMSNGLYMYWQDVDAAFYRRVQATDEGNNWYSFSFTLNSYPNVNVIFANESVSELNDPSEFTASTHRSQLLTVYRDLCLEMAPDNEPLFDVQDADCSAKNHDYRARNLNLDVSNTGGGIFSFEPALSYAALYRIVYKAMEYSSVMYIYPDEINNNTYSLYTDQDLTIESFAVESYDMNGNFVAMVVNNEKKVIRAAANDAKATNLSYSTTNAKDFILSWDAAVSKDVKSYRVMVYKEGNSLRYSANGTSLDLTLYESGEYNWAVVSLDANGNEIARSQVKSLICITDQSYVLQNVLATVDGDKLTFSWTTNAPAVVIYIAGQLYYPGSSPYTITMSMSGVFIWQMAACLTDDFGDFMALEQTVVEGFSTISSDDIADHYYGVTLAAEEGGTVVGSGVYAEGDQATITAVPNAGYAFDTWSDGVTTATRTLTITDDVFLTASFRLLKNCTLYFSLLPANGGTITVNGKEVGNDETLKVKENDVINLIATPKQGYEFSRWMIGDEAISTTAHTFTVAKSLDITALFKLSNGLNNISAVGAEILTDGLNLSVTTLEPEDISVYNAVGAVVYQANTAQCNITLPVAGMYIVKVNTELYKVVLK